MIKFDSLLRSQIYDGDIAVGNPKVNLSCRSTRNEVGTIFINGYFVTLKYVTDPFSKQGDGFSLVITAYKDTCKCHRTLKFEAPGLTHCSPNRMILSLNF